MGLRAFLVTLFLAGYSFVCSAQTYSLDNIKPDSTTYENVYVKAIYSDSLSSSFAIWVKKEVKPHKHNHHSEVVTVLEGKAWMTVAGKKSKIKKGDVVIIPKGTVHSVVTIGKKPLLVLSVQAPKFVGKDRVWIKDGGEY